MSHGSHATQPVQTLTPDVRGERQSGNLSKEANTSIQVIAKPPVNWFAAAAGVVSFGSVCMVLLGFGVSLAVEKIFGMPHAAVFDSTFELMDLASIAVVELIPSVLRTIADGSLPVNLYKVFGPIVGTITAVFLLLTLIGWFYEPPKSRKVEPVGSTTLERLHWGLTPKRYFWGNALIGLAILLYPLLSLLGILTFLLLATVLAIVPIIGMSAGNAYIHKWAIAPEQCRSPIAIEDLPGALKSRAFSRDTAKRFATCVILKKDKEMVASGRVVLYTSRSIVLMDTLGRVKKVPTAGLVVEVTDALP